jgi:hypothetical protein
LEAIVDLEADQDELLGLIVAGPLVSSEELHALGILPVPASVKGPASQDDQMSPQIPGFSL